MFTQNIKLMEGPQEVITSVIRAERFEDTYIARRKAFFIFYPAYGINEVVDAAEKWEVRLLAGTFAVSSCESGAQQIECRPKGIDDGAHASVDHGWQWELFAKYRDFLAGPTIEIPDFYARVRLLPSVKLFDEEWELGSSPLDSGISVFEVFSHCARS